MVAPAGHRLAEDAHVLAGIEQVSRDRQAVGSGADDDHVARLRSTQHGGSAVFGRTRVGIARSRAPPIVCDRHLRRVLSDRHHAKDSRLCWLARSLSGKSPHPMAAIMNSWATECGKNGPRRCGLGDGMSRLLCNR
jgi:hypothetical protein